MSDAYIRFSRTEEEFLKEEYFKRRWFIHDSATTDVYLECPKCGSQLGIENIKMEFSMYLGQGIHVRVEPCKCTQKD